jgi:hypothetical protein
MIGVSCGKIYGPADGRLSDAAASIAACSPQMNYVVTEYGKVDKIEFVEPASQEVFWIFPSPSVDKLMVSVNPGRAAQRGALSGVTLGLAENAPLDQVYLVVTESYLKSIGRECKATSATVLLDPQYEVAFTCS